MHARAFLVTILSVSLFGPTHAAPPQDAHNIVNTSDSLQLSDRAAFNATCCSPNEPALARANSDSVINVCCPPDHPNGGRMDMEKSGFRSSVKPANVVKCEGPKTIPTVLAKSGIKICETPGNARRSDMAEPKAVGGVESLYLPDEFPNLSSPQNYTTHDNEGTVSAVGNSDTDITLPNTRDLITAECFHNYIPTLAHHDAVSTINICCPYVFPQGGWHLNTDPICCPAGVSREDCSKGDLLHVNADNVKRCLGPGNLPVGTHNFHVSVCKALSADEVERGVPTLDDEGLGCNDNNWTACHLKHHPRTIAPPEIHASAMIKRSSDQVPMTCPFNSSPQVLKDFGVLYVGICCPKTSAEPVWLDAYSTPTCCIQGVNQRECLQHVHWQTVPILPENCNGSRNGTYNKVEVCKWLPQTSSSNRVIGKRSLLLISASKGSEASIIDSVTLLKWLVGVSAVLAMAAL